MAEQTVTQTDPDPVKPTPIEETQAYKDAVARAVEERRLNLEAEYRRKEKDLESAHAPKQVVGNGRDFFKEWGEKYGLPDGAGRELTEATIGYVNGTLIPLHLKPITASHRKAELRSQRADLRSANPKLAKLDDQYHAEAMKLLDPVEALGPDSYAKALHMVIGSNIEAIEAAREAGKEPVREPAPGPEPVAASGPVKAGKTTVNAQQQQFLDEKGFTVDEFVEMMRERARKMESNGKSKPEIRKILGGLLGNIEF